MGKSHEQAWKDEKPDLFHNLLQDVYHAEKQLLRTLPKLAQKASSGAASGWSRRRQRVICSPEITSKPAFLVLRPLRSEAKAGVGKSGGRVHHLGGMSTVPMGKSLMGKSHEQAWKD